MSSPGTILPASAAASPHPANASRAAVRARATVAMLVSALIYSVMCACAKWLSGGYAGGPPMPAAQVSVFRYLIGMIPLFLSPSFVANRPFGTDRKGLVLRGLLGGCAATAFFVGIQMTSLTNAMMLNASYIVWGPLLAIPWAGERWHRRSTLYVAVALVGVALITQPTLGRLVLGDAIALGSGLATGAAFVQVRQFRGRESSRTIFLYLNLIGLPLAAATMAVSGAPVVRPSSAQAAVLLVVGLTSYASQVLLCEGFKALTTAIGVTLSLTTLVFTALIGHTAFGEFIDPAKAAGLGLVLAAAYGMNRIPSDEPDA